MASQPSDNNERLRLLMDLLSEFKLYAVGDHPLFLSWDELYDRVLIALQQDADATGGSVTPVDGCGGLILHGEFDVQDILRLAIENNRVESRRHQIRVEHATAARGFPVCVKCYGTGKFTQWEARAPGKLRGFDKIEVACPLCEGTGHNL